MREREEHLPVRVITDCTSLFDCLAKDASVPDDRGTVSSLAAPRENDLCNRSDPQRKYESLAEETSYKQQERNSGPLAIMDLEQRD